MQLWEWNFDDIAKELGWVESIVYSLRPSATTDAHGIRGVHVAMPALHLLSTSRQCRAIAVLKSVSAAV